MSKKIVKVAITGAAGQIGYSLIFRIASGQMFGTDTDVCLHLLELPSEVEKVKGVVMEVEDCAFPLVKSISATDDPVVAFNDIDWALLIGSVPRKAGMERSDLLKINANVFVDQGKALSEKAKKTCKVLVVGNPCNTNAYIAKEIAKNIPDENFFALTMLDQNRAVAQLSMKSECEVSQIEKIAIWGNHSATQYPDFYNATIKGSPVFSVINDENWLQNDFIKIVQKRGAAIIGARGASSAASAANAVVNTVVKLTTLTKADQFFSLAVCSDGSYGIEKGLIFGFPVRSDGEKWEIVQGIQHNSFAEDKIKETYKELLEEKSAVSNILL